MLVVFFAIVNMCELVNCRPHGQTTRMTVSTKKPAQNPVKPEEQQHQKQEWKIEHIQHKIIKGDIKAYPTVQHPLLPFSLERPDLWKRAAQAAALVSRYQKAMKILEKYFPLEAVRCSPIWWKLGPIENIPSSHNEIEPRFIDGCHLALFKKLNQFNLFFGLDDKPLEFGWFNYV